jgi:ribosomal protein S27E
VSLKGRPSERRKLERGGWRLEDNPAYAGREPTPLKAKCHDGSPFLTIRCGTCGGEMHQHESVTAGIPRDAEIASPCKECGELLVFPPGWFHEAFAELRRLGWVAE